MDWQVKAHWEIGDSRTTRWWSAAVVRWKWFGAWCSGSSNNGLYTHWSSRIIASVNATLQDWCLWQEWISLYVAFSTLKQYRDRRRPEAGTMAYSYFEWFQGFFIVHSTIDSTVNSMHLNSFGHCICTSTMTNIRPDRDSNLVPSGYKPQSMLMSHQEPADVSDKRLWWDHSGV